MSITRIHQTQPTFPYLKLVIVCIVVKYFWEQYLNLRQIRLFLIKQLPQKLEIVGLTEKQFKRSQKYQYDRLAFEMYVKSIKMAIELIFYLCEFMPFLWRRVVDIFQLDEYSEFQRGLAFVFIESLRQKLIDVPNSLYNTLVIEKRYKLNQKTFTLFFQDEIVESFLMAMIIPVFLYGYLQVVELGGEYFFFYMQLFILVIILLQNIIYPNFVAPLFNHFQELEENQLKEAIKQLSQNIQFPLQKILVMDGSKRSDHSNAYFFGLWNNKRIVLYDTLITRLNTQEVLSVVGHEMGHWKYRHGYINIALFIMKILFIFYVFSKFRNEDSIFLSFGFREKSIFIGSALFFTLFEPLNQALTVIELIISRFFEYKADEFAYKLGLGTQLTSGLIKLSQNNLMIDPLQKYAWYYNSHPTLFERLDYLQELSNKRY